MPFPADSNWTETLAFLERHLAPLTPVLAPNEFLDHFPGTYPYQVAIALPAAHFEFAVLHKLLLRELPPAFLRDVVQELTPVFANALFVVYAKTPPTALPELLRTYVKPVQRHLAAIDARGLPARAPTYAAVVMTHNRPHSLARTLPQVRALGVPTLIVDDASTAENARENDRIADEHGVPVIRMPENRGVCNSVNIGVSYWLADLAIDWISTFQDDVDVHPELLHVLERVQDARVRPLLAGRDAPEHLTYATGAIGGYAVLYKRSLPGQHLHAHRDYWAAVLPVPTQYLGAPKPMRGRGSDEDWWITAWSPNAITKRGGYVVCVPGLVRTFHGDSEGSTWGNVSARRVDGSAGSEIEALRVPTTDRTERWVPAPRAGQ